MNVLPEARIYQSELEFMSECILYYPNVETGGDFFGFWSKEGNPVIQYVIGPGNGTTRTGTSFYQDIGYLRECGNIIHDRFGLEHIGAWHSHHQLNIFGPSSGDVQTMRNLFRTQETSRFLISICNIENESHVSIGGFLFSRNNEMDYTSTRISTISGLSPIRDSLRDSNSGLRSIKESVQKIPGPSFNSNNRPISYSLRFPEAHTFSQKNDEPRKASFSKNSYWSTREGQKYLKSTYEKLIDRSDLSNVEIKQLVDGRPAISFDFQGSIHEIRFPDDFPNRVPEVILVSKRQDDNEHSWKKKFSFTKPHRVEVIYQIIRTLQIFDDPRDIKISEQE